MTEKLIYSAVAIPGEPDYDGEILTPEEIQYAAHKFMSDYRIIDPEHVCALTKECYSVGTPVESTILQKGMTVKSVHGGNDMYLPKGTWILGIEVTDDSEWTRIVNGERTGLSLTAARTTVKSRVLIRDLGKNWEAKTVSIVKDPAVPKAKFFQIVGDGMMNDEATKSSRFQTFFDKIEEAVKSFKSEEEEVVVDEAPTEVDAEANLEEEASIKSEESDEEPATEVQEDEIEEVDNEEDEEQDVVEEVAEETEEAEAVKFVTADELQSVKDEILEAVKHLMQPATKDEAVKSDPEEEEEESSEAEEKKDDEDLDEIRKKDLKIAELEKKIEALEAKLKTANKSRSKGIPAHFDSEKKVVKNLYDDDGRDLYGRVIKN